MIDATVLLLSFTDQYNWGFSGKNRIFLNCSSDVDDGYYGSLCYVFRYVIRYDIYKGANKGGICFANNEILLIARTYMPKYIYYPCNFSSIVTQDTLTELRKLGCIVIADFFDDDVLFEPMSKWITPFVDYVVTRVPSLVDKYINLGVRCVLAPTMAMNPALLRNLHKCEKIYDATFVGSLYKSRRDFIESVGNYDIIIKYLGGGNENKIHSSMMVEIFNRSRINVNLSSGQNGRSIILARVFEIPLCGGFLLSEYFPELERWFDINREIVCFTTPKEASEKIKYYLQYPEEREKIAEQGYFRANQNYTGIQLFRKIFNEIESDLLSSGRPEIIEVPDVINTLRTHDAAEYFKWVIALKKSSSSLRNEWLATANLVIKTDPGHKMAKVLLDRYKIWGDPEPVIGRLRIISYWIIKQGASYYLKLKSFAVSIIIPVYKLFRE